MVRNTPLTLTLSPLRGEREFERGEREQEPPAPIFSPLPPAGGEGEGEGGMP